MKQEFKALAALTVAFFSLSSSAIAQSDDAEIKNCSDGGETSTSNELLIDGYPRQQKISAAEIEVGRSEPCKDTITYPIRGFAYVVPDAEVSVSGLWVKVGQKRVAKNNTGGDEYEYSNSLGITEEFAAEASMSMSTSVTGGVSFFGLVGAEATLEASIGLALTYARGTESGKEWVHSTEVQPGEEVQLWTRAMRVHTKWKPTKYDYRNPPNGTFLDPMAAAQEFVKDVYLPSYKALFLRNEMTEREADAALEAIKLGFVANWPAQNTNDTIIAPNALNLLSDFLDEYAEDGFESKYLVPYNEVYTVRYEF